MVELFANSGDPDQTPHSAASDRGLHCLPITLYWSQDYNCTVELNMFPKILLFCIYNIAHYETDMNGLFLHLLFQKQ